MDKYQIFSRPTLARNKYNETQKRGGGVSNGTSFFSNSGSTIGSGDFVQYSVFFGATSQDNGSSGLVPAPLAGEQNYFLQGTSSWTEIPAYAFEWNNTRDTLTLDGSLNISDTISTQTLNVTGSAHFWELVIDKVRSAGGNMIISPANGKIDYIASEPIEYVVDANEEPFQTLFFNTSESTGLYGLEEIFTAGAIDKIYARRVYIKCSDANKETATQFMVGDMVRCKTFNLNESVNENKDYWTFVLATGTDYYVDPASDEDVDCIYIDLFSSFVRTGGSTYYTLGTTVTDSGAIVNPQTTSYSLRAVPNDTEVINISRRRAFAVNELDTTISEATVPSRATIASGTTLTNDIITTDGTVYNSGTTLSEDLILKKGDIIKDFNSIDGSLYNIDEIEDTEDNEEEVNEEVTIKSRPNRSSYRGTDNAQAITEFTFGYGELNIEVGDDLVVLGHLFDGERQEAILLSAYDPLDTEVKAPAICQYYGINKFTTLSNFRTNTLASNGNEFTGSFLVDYNGNYIDINERLNIFSTDLVTGLETVGIHLDGENSTIKLVGSVEIRQNGDGDVDTLTVYDESNIMRVKVSPESLPAKSAISTTINPTTNLTFATKTGQSVPTYSTITERHTWKEFIWSWNHQWQYYLTSSYFDLTTTVQLGTFSSNQKFTISGFKATFNSKAYFKGTTYTSNRGTAGTDQYIDSVVLRLKRKNGSSSYTVTSKNITSSSSISVTSEKVTINYTGNPFGTDYNISTGGNYFIEAEIIFYVYASVTYSSSQSNPYFMFDYSLTASSKLIRTSTAMTRIGNNGIMFNTNKTNQYFYSGSGGIELMWGLNTTDGSNKVGISLDSNGYRRYKQVYTFASSGTYSSSYSYYIPNDADVIFVTGSYVKLYTSSSNTPPEGKEIIVVGNSTTTYQSANINNPSCTVYDAWAGEDGRDWSGTVTNYRKHFIWHNSEWWEI